MTRKSGKRRKLPPLTAEERRQRFVDMAKEVDAATDPKTADRAFKRVLKPQSTRQVAKR